MMLLCRVQVPGFGYDHAWATNLELFKHFTDASRGVRRLGAAAVDLCHTALGMQLLMLPAPSALIHYCLSHQFPSIVQVAIQCKEDPSPN